ncbi:DUF3397 domain-containing protein [Peribacillus sp. JNUCC 23]
MISIFSSVAATFITMPILAYIIFFIAMKQVTGNHRRSVHVAMDISTLLFMFSVHYLIVAIWDRHIIWILLLAMIAIACMVVVVHYRVKGEIIFQKVLRGFWRLNFAFFFCVYFVLLLYGITTRVLLTF